MKNLHFLAIFLFLGACGGEQKPDSLEGKQALLAQYRQQIADLQGKADALEKEIGASSQKGAILKNVTVHKIEPKIFEHFIEVQGNVESEKNVLLTPEMSGILTSRSVSEGQDVSQGQVLAVIDAEPLRKSIAELETRLELARTVFQRQENLWKQKIGSEIQYLQAKNNVESLEKSVESLKSQLKKSAVSSPISGTVDQVFVNVGEMANPAMPIARIVNLSQVMVNAEVSENYLTTIKKGDEVVVSFPNLNLEKKLKISTIGQFINPQNRSFRVRIDIDNKDRMLRPNTSANIKIKDFSQQNSLSVPDQLIQRSTNGEYFMFVVRPKDGKNLVEKVMVKTGISYQGFTLISEGLQAGDFVIEKGYSEVVSGEEVNIIKE